MMTPKQALGRKLRRRREELGLNQEQVGDAISIGRVGYGLYESGKNAVAATDIPLLARVLKVPVSYFFEGADAPHSSESYVEDPDADGRRPQLVAFYDEMTADGKDDLLALAEALWKRKRAAEHVYGGTPESDASSKE